MPAAARMPRCATRRAASPARTAMARARANGALAARRGDRTMRLRVTGKALPALAATLLLAAASISEAAAPAAVCEAGMIEASRKYGIPTGILYAVGLTETGRRGSLHSNA